MMSWAPAVWWLETASQEIPFFQGRVVSIPTEKRVASWLSNWRVATGCSWTCWHRTPGLLIIGDDTIPAACHCGNQHQAQEHVFTNCQPLERDSCTEQEREFIETCCRRCWKIWKIGDPADSCRVFRETLKSPTNAESTNEWGARLGTFLEWGTLRCRCLTAREHLWVKDVI